MEILFSTRQVFEVSHKYMFKEKSRGKEMLDKMMNLYPNIRLLLENAKFVTVPNPSGNMMLPGEWPTRAEEEFELAEVS